jgi:hypothetical protein
VVGGRGIHLLGHGQLRARQCGEVKSTQLDERRQASAIEHAALVALSEIEQTGERAEGGAHGDDVSRGLGAAAQEWARLGRASASWTRPGLWAETQRRAASQLRQRALFLAAAFVVALDAAATALFLGDQAQRAPHGGQQHTLTPVHATYVYAAKF